MYSKLIVSITTFIEVNFKQLASLDNYAIFNAWTSDGRTTVDVKYIKPILSYIEDAMAIRKSEVKDFIKEVQS